jgi:hypothetical protein
MNSEREVKLGSRSELIGWLQEYDVEPTTDLPGRKDVQLRRGRFLRWE